MDFHWNDVAEVQVSVYDLLGAPVILKKFSAGEKISFDMKNQVPGMYVIKIEAPGQEVVKLFVLAAE